MIRAADYSPGSKRLLPALRTYHIENGRRTHIADHVVTCKRHARKLAANLGYTPWNF